jgi:hypothetical protein
VTVIDIADFDYADCRDSIRFIQGDIRKPDELGRSFDHADSIRAAAQRYETQIDSAAQVVRSLFTGKELPAVIASDKQAPFLSWLGFRVVAAYGNADDFSAHELTRLARVALDSSVQLVVDNLQSGPDAGLGLAQAAQAEHVTLTNFPLKGNYPETLLGNAQTLALAIQ